MVFYSVVKIERFSLEAIGSYKSKEIVCLLKNSVTLHFFPLN